MVKSNTSGPDCHGSRGEDLQTNPAYCSHNYLSQYGRLKDCDLKISGMLPLLKPGRGLQTHGSLGDGSRLELR